MTEIDNVGAASVNKKAKDPMAPLSRKPITPPTILLVKTLISLFSPS